MADSHPKFDVALVTPDGPAFEGEAEMIVVPGAAGEIGVLARHAPLVATLKAGSTRIHLSPSEVLEVDRPKRVRTRFGSWLLRGVSQVTFEDQDDGTRLTQEFWTNGIISAVIGRIFAFGSYKGSFRGELNSFVRLAEREARSDP